MAATTDSFLSTLQTSPQNFLQPSLPLYTDSVAYLKHILDPLAQDVSAEQQRRQQEARKKRKRGQHAEEEDEVLRLKQIHAQGFGIEQVWEQARRVIDAARSEAERSLAELHLLRDGNVRGLSDADGISESDDEDLGVEGVDYEVEGLDDGSSVEGYENGVDEVDEEDVLEDGDDDDMIDDYDELNEDSEGEEPAEEFVADKFGLNDGFFSIDAFNRQSEFLEQQDTRGDEEDASDEEEIDWDMNPLTAGPAAGATNGTNGVDDVEESEEEDDENGPTFGDPDAPSEDEDEIDGGELDDVGGMSNANDLMYTDFFAPPAQKKKKAKKDKPRNRADVGSAGKAQVEGVEDEMERTMAAVHRDLFEDDASEAEEDADEVAEEPDRSDPRARRSTHERRQAAIAEEIRKLEAANVAKRKWTLSGEARAADRPINSLLEEDVEFERTGKPVPVITADLSESIEELIKRRILAFDFQDIPRRRPDDLATGKDGRRGRIDFELDDSKSKKGLAEEYEEEHLRRTDPNFVDADDEKLGKEQKAIEALWKEVAGQLDSLSSWHFRPKPAAPQLDIRVDAPTIAMEDARPNAGGEVATTASQLAPQEVYRAGDASKSVREEVAGKSGLPAGREELTREERRRRRRRDKERIRKASANVDTKPEGKAAKEKKAVLDDLKRGGVKVIGKKGEVQDVEGRKVRQNGSGQGAARYKL